MAIRVGSAELYSYDIPLFLGYVWDFDGLLLVLLCRHLVFVKLANDLFDHTVHGCKPILSSYHLLCFGHSWWRAALVTSSLQASGDNDLIHSEE